MAHKNKWLLSTKISWRYTPQANLGSAVLLFLGISKSRRMANIGIRHWRNILIINLALVRRIVQTNHLVVEAKRDLNTLIMINISPKISRRTTKGKSAVLLTRKSELRFRSIGNKKMNLGCRLRFRGKYRLGRNRCNKWLPRTFSIKTLQMTPKSLSGRHKILPEKSKN